MEAYRHAYQAHTRTSHLTKLYSDAKKSAVGSTVVHPFNTAQFAALHRKYRIQKDRLITWGLAWSDDEKGPDGNIDASIATAGLTETVESVLRNIKEVTEEAESIKSASWPTSLGLGGEKISAVTQPAIFDDARYEDLLRDLTASVDTLYDLSRSRRALARGEHPSFNSTTSEKSTTPSALKPTPIPKELSRRGSFASSVTTLVNPPSFHKPSLSPYTGLPPQINSTALRLPEEGPPPYESIGVPSTTRLIAQLTRAKASETVQNALGSSAAEVPVLVEYANFDATYRDTGVPPPLQRLETLAAYLQPMRPESQTSLSLLGYFEDPKQPRIGLVYDAPYSIQNRLQGNVETATPVLTPVSLLKLVQKAGKAQAPNGDVAVPALEYRFRLALQLVEQLHDLHLRDMSHGNINSSSVIFMTTADETPLRQKHMRSPLWASYDLFSKCSIEGINRAINLNIYRHPEDKSHSANRDSSTDIRFDLYGLALVLLEVGLWTPISDLYKQKYSLADFKLRIEKLWIPKLAAKCGSAYMRVVQTCLRCADDVEEAKLTTDALYERLLERLRLCCLLDEDDYTADPLAPNDASAETSTLSYGDRRLKRKPLPSPDRSLVGRQLSDPPELLRSNTVATETPAMPYRLSSLPNLAAAATMAHGGMSPSSERKPSRQPSLRSHASHTRSLSQMSERISQRFRLQGTPSLKDYKRRIVMIQQHWRERCERHKAAYERFAEEARARQSESKQDSRPALSNIPENLKTQRKEFTHAELPIPRTLLDEFNEKIAGQLMLLCQQALKGSPESSSIGLNYYGETPETARPTLLVHCTSTAKVKQVLRRHFKYDPAIFDLRVKRGKVTRCRKSRRSQRADDTNRSMAPASALDKAVNPDYQERPLCGASIGAYRDDEHLPPCSFGGIIIVDGTPYGMSVHHMLENNDDDDDEQDAVAGAEATDSDSETSSIRSNSDNISLFSESDDGSTVRPASVVSQPTASDDDQEGDVQGITPDDYEEIAVTQPALDDAIDLDLHVDVNEDDDDDDDNDSGIDEDHLLSYKLGQVYASSGLKRTASSMKDGFKSISQSLPQEIDWSLFELVPPRIHPFNIVKGGRKHCKAGSLSGLDSYPAAVRNGNELACARVHCIGRTSGLGSGVMSSTMELVKIHGRSTFSASWTADGNFGVGGDSGAWVISNEDGRVCGHVVASRKGRAYICPMDLLLNDIKQTLGAEQVVLPTRASSRASAVQSTAASEEASESLAKAVGRLSFREDGGVALPASPARSSLNRHSVARVIEPMQTVG